MSNTFFHGGKKFSPALPLVTGLIHTICVLNFVSRRKRYLKVSLWTNVMREQRNDFQFIHAIKLPATVQCSFLIWHCWWYDNLGNFLRNGIMPVWPWKIRTHKNFVKSCSGPKKFKIFAGLKFQSMCGHSPKFQLTGSLCIKVSFFPK